MPPKTSFVSTTAISIPKSPPKTCRSTRKRAQSSTDATAEPPAKKAATGDREEEKEEKEEKGGKGRRGKGIRCENNPFMNFRLINLIILIDKLL